MAKCPSCQGEVTFFYQIGAMIDDPKLCLNSFRMPTAMVFVCNKCKAHLNMTAGSAAVFYGVFAAAFVGVTVLFVLFDVFVLKAYFHIFLSQGNIGFLLVGVPYLVIMTTILSMLWALTVDFKAVAQKP